MRHLLYLDCEVSKSPVVSGPETAFTLVLCAYFHPEVYP